QFMAVAGCIDGSLNVMAVCGPNCESSLFTQWDENHWRHFPGALLLGDSGYPLLSWLMTPVVQAGANAVGSQRYLRRHKSTRRLIECAFGQKTLELEEWELDADNDISESDGEEDDDVPPGTVQGKDVHSSLVRMFAVE
ncbi:hypothetical protein ILUMI_22907, partial [Ignelater luminosus]